MNKDKILSPNQIAFQRFKKSITGVISLTFIILCGLIALFAYFIIPDKTPYANTQILELSTRKPGFEVDMLLVPKQNIVENTGFLSQLINGKPSPYRQIPFDSLKIEKEKTIIYVYNPDESQNVIEEIIPNNDIVPGIEFNDKEEATHYINNKCVKHRKFILGTDQFGRDFLSRLLLGTRISFSVGFIAVFMSLLIGIFIGSLGGFFRGRVDDFMVWLINVVWSIPTLLIVIAITFVLGKGVVQVFIAVGLTMWVEVARVTRGQILSVRETTFVEAGRALGFKNARIIMKHIIPNVINPIIVISAANFASAILLEAGLSFLGIGVQPPMPSWGSMIKENYAYIILNDAYLAILPGIAIMLLVLAFMLLGNALRDSLDVKKN
ncbi:MAG: ABC transporter permease [Bacteroidales bacterium]|nr:ABC transporter permease [Bacteroidales bacterium]